MKEISALGNNYSYSTNQVNKAFLHPLSTLIKYLIKINFIIIHESKIRKSNYAKK